MLVFFGGSGGAGGGGGTWGWGGGGERGGEVEGERTVSGSLSNGPVKAQ